MKKRVFLLLLLAQTTLLFSQTDSISEGRAAVYFTRSSGLGGLVNFTYFDGKKVIGKFNGSKYMKYECEPGKHLFWARSENKSFVEAELLGGKTYIIDVIPTLGGLKASVILTPVDKNNYKLKPIQKLLEKKDAEIFEKDELDALQLEMADVIVRGFEKYNELKEKGKNIPILLPSMTVEASDLIYVKK
ncbi:hypothetical protein NO995_02440 [Aestuariibaculum sp. M13]|uniref:hypothetical protein n=1 Tax=Aestuariibaculum sp. M13 TaxID=2967132 RepID=UPI002159E54D|nr:hypothetical protein [Aestuariibaculum sp. M13]MCR8666523.1 hypothetical protein [Aestuariibaculum sp. M13]